MADKKKRIFALINRNYLMYMRSLLSFLLFLLVVTTGQVKGAGYNLPNLPYEPVYGVRSNGMNVNSTYVVVIDGDTISMVYLKAIYVFPPERFKSKKEETYYWKLVRDIKKVYPLSKIVYYTLYETMEYLETIPDEDDRDKHLRKMEKELIKEYEPTLRKMTYNQGKLLLKLIDRQCNSSSFELIQAYRGSFTAHFWQGIAKLFKTDLKSTYEPINKDYMIERIVIRIDQGQL